MTDQGNTQNKFDLLKQAFDAMNYVNGKFYDRILELEEEIFDLKEQNERLQNDKKTKDMLEQIKGKLGEIGEGITSNALTCNVIVNTVVKVPKEIDVVRTNLQDFREAYNANIAAQEKMNEREENVQDAEKKITAAEDAKTAAEAKLETAEKEIERYKKLWESAKQAAAQSGGSAGGVYSGRDNANRGGKRPDNMQKEIDAQVEQKTEELEKKYREEIEKLNKRIAELEEKLEENENAINEPADGEAENHDQPADTTGEQYTDTPAPETTKAAGGIGNRRDTSGKPNNP